MTDSPKFIHYYNPETQISIALPSYWQEVKNLEPGQVMYVCNSDLPYPPQLVIQTFALPPNEQKNNAFEELADGLISSFNLKKTHSDRLYITIDNYPASLDIFTVKEPEIKISVTYYLVCLQFHYNLCGILGMLASKQQKTYIPILEKAVQSIRIIPNCK